MSANRNKNLFGQSRWHIITELRKKPQGVKELSVGLGVSENAIRPHLSFLERDGLVRQKGVKQSGGKPAHIFELTDEAEQLFPKAYSALLSHIFAELRVTHNDKALNDLLKATAKRLAREWPKATGDTLNKIKSGVNILNELGGLAEISRENEKCFINGYSCPLGSVTKEHPEVCYLAEMLLEDLTGLKLKRCCSYDDKPKCRFQVMNTIQ